MNSVPLRTRGLYAPEYGGSSSSGYGGNGYGNEYGNGYGAAPQQNQTVDFLRNEQDKQFGLLSGKLSEMIHVGSLIGQKIRDSSQLLEDLESGVTRNQSLLDINTQRIKRLSLSATSNPVLWLIFFFFGVLLFLYFLL
eukprot:TRINITY_DN3119_c0_g1_i1.p1 TRINITY_DN3119_c0_g1~~TRINITY_DN3119_c0_g1_i1.p1  ORF type:complete len:152 (+),score=25.98 TRINITY_DN3119_c0_g1_i1:45-458(+)